MLAYYSCIILYAFRYQGLVIACANPLLYTCSGFTPSTQKKFPWDAVETLKQVLDQDPLAQLDEQDKDLIWRMR